MTDTPFHRDEQRAQALAGRSPGGHGIRSLMPDQHRLFFAALPYVFLGVVGPDGWPVATMLAGPPGFVHAPNAFQLRIDGMVASDDPAAPALVPDAEIGVLGLDLATRRRNRANGRIAAVDASGFLVNVRQSFGNCPQYIQARAVRPETRERGPSEALTRLDGKADALIRAADTFFVASRSRSAAGPGGGADISHRGGRPGFVAIAGDTLAIPDYRGNRYFNTLGNLLGEPRSALLFVDFDTGDLLQLKGRAAIDWTAGDPGIAGAERLWRFRIEAAWRREAALPLAWTEPDYAPTTLRTGTWDRPLPR
jgi:predicted pyridoxine 5'-phosphate oxidase superfamily flavin-nucleotide-binding protein